MNGDEYIDVISASCGDDKIYWFENDGNENFSLDTLASNMTDAWSVYAIDIDNDGDIDILSASEGDNKIAWHENEGNGNFIDHTISTNAYNTQSVYGVDLDGDNDMDVLSASYSNNKIAWYENLQITGIDEDNNLISKFKNLKNFPNPFNPSGAGRSPSTTIEFNLNNNSKVNLSIYNIKGQLIKTLVDKNLFKGKKTYIWDGINNQGLTVPSGIYLYKLEVDGKLIETKKMTLIK